MKKLAVFCILFLFAALSFGQEFDFADFFRDLNDTINNFDFENYSAGSEGLLFLPSVYLSKKWQTYASFGIMVHNPFHNEEQFENEEFDDQHPTTIFKAAFILRRKKTNVMLYFDYNSDYSWGLSIKLKF